MPELSLLPRRGRLIVILILCLATLAVIGDAIISTLVTSNNPASEVLFSLLFIVCLIYLLGLAWSVVRHLTSRQSSFQANNDGLTLRHLPFLGNVTIPWSEVKSIHTHSSLLFAYLCIVPHNTQQLIARYGFLRFVFNASTRFNRRTGTPLAVSQTLFRPSVKELAQRLEQDYGVKYTPGFEKNR